MKVYQKIARTLQAMENCPEQWQDKYNDAIEEIEKEYFPHGSGLDGDCLVNVEKSSKDKILIEFDYYCINDNGYYERLGQFPTDPNGWLALDLIITPELSFGFKTKIIWYRKENEQYIVQKYKPLLSDYLYDTWEEALDREYKGGF